MSDIKKIRLNDTDYDLRDARIVSGTIAPGETILIDGDVFLAIFRTVDCAVIICIYDNWGTYPIVQNINVQIWSYNGECWQIVNGESIDATYDLFIHKD